MCGIVGCITNNNIVPFLLDGLSKLEYRGYDSAGIATLQNNEIKVTRAVGKVSDLQKIVDLNNKSNIGIAHTRWATHGKPTINNTHPITSGNGEWAVVHNGIIENFANLKDLLKNAGYQFQGETDTEVIVNLLQYNESSNIMEAIIKTCNMLVGSYALLIINKHMPNNLYLAKNKSPLYISAQNNEVIVASDPICFKDNIKDYYSLNDNEFAIASINNILFYNNNYKQIQKPTEQYWN